MSSNSQEPDHYRVLNVHHQADPEIIEAAYQKMREKYRGAAAAEKDIDAAYAVLSDPEKRAAYDARRRALMRPAASAGPLAPAPEKQVAPKQAAQPPMAPIPAERPGDERHKIQGKCSLTGQGFDMVLERASGMTTRYRVIGFEPWPSRPSDPQPREGFFHRLFRLAGIGSGDQRHPLDRDEPVPQTSDVRDEYLDFEQLDFSVHRCPVCNGGPRNSTWAMCGRCSQILCMGALDGDLQSSQIRCPWCGTTLRFGAAPARGGRVKSTSRPPMIDPKPDNPMLPPSGKKSLPRG